MGQNISFNIFNVLIISITIHGLIFSLILFASKKYRSKKPIRYLALLILFLSLSNLYYWFIDTRISYGWRPYRYLFVPWELLIMPFFYFFVEVYLNKVKSINKLLFIPFLIDLSARIFLVNYRIFFSTQNEGVLLSNQIIRIGEYITPAFSIFVIILIFRMILKYEQESNQFSNDTIIVETKWLKQLLYSGIGVCAVLVLYIVFKMFFVHGGTEYNFIYYFVWIGMCFIIYLVGYNGIYHVGIFNERNKIREVSLLNPKNEPDKKYNIKRFEELNTIICCERLYANPNCGLSTLSSRFEMSEGYLSQLFNTFSGSNFTTYINNLRIEEINLILQSKEYSDYTIVALSLEVGFNSKSTFYNAFKKRYGMTPSEFRKRSLSKEKKLDTN